MDNNQVNVNGNNERRGRGLFYGVVAVATFIIMAVGATFAYFAATANSANTSITAGSTALTLELLSYESAWSKSDLIPVDNNIVRYGFVNQNDTTVKVDTRTCFNSDDEVVDCDDESVDDDKTVVTYTDDLRNAMCVDDYGNSICSVYVFQIVNDNASPQTMTFSIVSTLNTFEHLRAMAYEVNVSDVGAYESTDNNNHTGDPSSFTVMNGSTTLSDGEYTPVYINRKGVSRTALTDAYGELSDVLLPNVQENEASDENTSMRTVVAANNVNIDSNETKTFAIVLYIQNLTTAQSEDEDSLFRGAINVTTGDGTTGVSGYISAAG